jgi:L-fucose isomerase-like protein
MAQPGRASPVCYYQSPIGLKSMTPGNTFLVWALFHFPSVSKYPKQLAPRHCTMTRLGIGFKSPVRLFFADGRIIDVPEHPVRTFIPPTIYC